jgi:hypothetical protein
MTQRFHKLSPPLRVLIYAAAAVALLAVAAGVGATTALLVIPGENSSGEANSQQSEKAKSEQANQQPKQAGQQESASDQQSEADYLDAIGDIQSGAVDASLQSNAMLLRYDRLSSNDIENLKANYTTLGDYRDRVDGLDPNEKYEAQYDVFALAISELYAANKLAYRLSADPVSATEDDFDAYDQHIDEATSLLRRSNEYLNQDYKTTEAAQDVSLG